MTDDERLLELAAAIADGARVDWMTAASEATNPRARALVGKLEVLAGIARVQSNLLERGQANDRHPNSPSPGREIGGMRILRCLGEGLIGVVYEVAPDEAHPRGAAVKLIRWDLDARRIVRRFEEQAATIRGLGENRLAVVCEVGITPQGRPFFVQELAEGQPITDYCDAAGLNLVERVRLVIDICSALQHAHEAGLCHLDLKPPNVLTRNVDGAHQPKILDLGIPHALDDAWTRIFLMMAHGRVDPYLGYLSPEQVDFTGDREVDHRTDVFALAVLAYELVTGSQPRDPLASQQVSLAASLRAIIEDVPRLASQAIKELETEQIERLARSRGTRAEALIRQIPSELDRLVAKGLEKDPGLRPASAASFASELSSIAEKMDRDRGV
jgi:serine/threonine protein kinase